MVVAVSSLLQKQVLPLSGDCQRRRRLVSCASSLQQLLETAGGGKKKKSGSVFMYQLLKPHSSFVLFINFCMLLFCQVFFQNMVAEETR